MSRMLIKNIAIIGAGTMGAQIACLFASAGIAVELFDLPSIDIKNTVLKKMAKLEPSPIAHPLCLENIFSRDLTSEKDLEKLTEVDWVIEAIVEKIEIKKELFKKIENYLLNNIKNNSNFILATNTSGLSIETMASILPEEIKPRFFGIHFFNPPRYLPLVEIIPNVKTELRLLDWAENFLVRYLGKSVLRAKDTPGFIANRMGVFSLFITIFYAEKFNIPIEIVDELTGKLLGRPKSATFRTADIVGLDVISHVLKTLKEGLKNCPYAKIYELPVWIENLIQQNFLGEKTKKGFYEKKLDGLWVYDLNLKTYRKKEKKPSETILKIFEEEKSWSGRFERIKKIKESKENKLETEKNEAQFLWYIFRELFIYAAYVSAQIQAEPLKIDLALSLGFGWKSGPFEIWQEAGWEKIRKEIEEGVNYFDLPKMPEWVFDKPEKFLEKFKSSLENLYFLENYNCYSRQIFPKMPKILKNKNKNKNKNKDGASDDGLEEVLFENEALILWRPNLNKNNLNTIGVISFKTKMGVISAKVLEGMEHAIQQAEKKLEGLVIFQKDHENFSVGADLMEAGELFLMEGPAALEAHLDRFQKTCLAIRDCSIPVVSAVRGFAFGGGCEFILHSDAVVAARESYIGLVELGVGLIPAAGGSKEFARRAALSLSPELAFQNYFKMLATAQVAKSAYFAKQMGFLRESDDILAHPDEILLAAMEKAKYLGSLNYQPESISQQMFKAQGREGRALVRTYLSNLKQGNYISEYDYYLADQLAYVMTGGEVDAGSLINETWLLKLEREVFLKLAEQEKTFERIDHMLKTGKPLRN